MSRLAASIGVILLLLPQAGGAAEEPTGLFETIFEQDAQFDAGGLPSTQVTTFVIRAMRTWNDRGIILSEKDVEAALNPVPGFEAILCQGKTDASGEPIRLMLGSEVIDGDSCLGLAADIRSLVAREREAESLGQDLLDATSGSELSIADEPNRPVNMAHVAMTLRKIWSSVDLNILPWKNYANDSETGMQELKAAVTALEEALKSTKDLDRAILRFHHGYFRDRREENAVWGTDANVIGEKLKVVADKLLIDGEDQSVTGEFITPHLAVPNVGLWARKDDLGLFWIAPIRFSYVSLDLPTAYPSIVERGERLAYPFSYEGRSPDINLLTPVCNRMVARKGYLCRPLPPETYRCDPPADHRNDITLTRCEEPTVSTSTHGPAICDGIATIYRDTGEPLIDPSNPGGINPRLVPVPTDEVCVPENLGDGTSHKVLYRDDIASHACYIGRCLLQSMNGHSLVPGRNPTLVTESTSPYLACIRQDPRLGLYAETAKPTPYALPLYLGLSLVADMEQAYCGLSGQTAHPLPGLCSLGIDETQETLQSGFFMSLVTPSSDVVDVERAKIHLPSLGAIIGGHASLEQATELSRKTFLAVAAVAQQTANLLLELKRAPLTTHQCPWTGPFPAPQS